MKNKRLWQVIAILLVGLVVLALRNRHSVSKDQLNADGIRDDVAEAIAHKFPESEKKRAAATQLARAFQMAIDHPDAAPEIDKNYYTVAKECLEAVESDGAFSELTNSSHYIEGIVVNSFPRSRAYIHYNARLSGQVFGVIKAKSSSCAFDLSKMRN